MKSDTKFNRRMFGVICLVAAIAMLAIGETEPASGSSHINFLIYWLICSMFAVLAMIAAMVDLRAVRREAREAQRNLFEDTLQQIELERRRREGRVNPDDGNDLKD